MLARIRKSVEEKDEGFTLIELLVVIIIIGILAAIAIPTFLKQREKGWDAASKAETKNIATALESLNTDTGSYTTVATSAATDAGMVLLKGQGFNASEAFVTSPGTIKVTNPTAGSYCISVSHKSQAAVFWKLESSGATAGSPTKATAAC